MLVPLLGVLLIRDETDVRRRSSRGPTAAWTCCAASAAGSPSRMVQPSRASTAWSALLVVGGLAVVYANLEPRYRLADQVPDKQQAVAASSRLDAKLTGANPIDVLIEFPKGASLYAPETLAMIADVHAVVEKQAGVGNVWSLETLRRWLAEKAGKHRRRDAQAICRHPAGASDAPLHLRRAGRRRGVGPHPGRRRSQLLPVVDELDNDARRGAQGASRLRRSRSPACRRSPRATAPA